MLDPYGFDMNSPLRPDNRPQTPGMQYDAQYETQKTRIRSDMVGTTAYDTDTITAVATTPVTIARLYTPKKGNFMMHTPFVALYEINGTALTDPNYQIYPSQGGSIPSGKYQIMSGWDYDAWQNLATTGTAVPEWEYFVVSIYNTGTVNTQIYYQSQAKFLASNGGQSIRGILGV